MATNNMRPIHPGEILREEFLVPLGMDAGELARALRLPLPEVGQIVGEEAPVTAAVALRLARYFGTTPQFWLDLQTSHDLRLARQQMAAVVEREVAPREAA